MNTVEFRIEDEKFFVDGKLVELPYTVGDVLEFSGLLVVRVDPPAGVIFNRNVFAIARVGEVVWQIAESPHGTEADKPYVGIFRNRDEGLVAANWNGVDYLVSLESGSVVATSFNK